jgi:hypothetical protein
MPNAGHLNNKKLYTPKGVRNIRSMAAANPNNQLQTPPSGPTPPSSTLGGSTAPGAKNTQAKPTSPLIKNSSGALQDLLGPGFGVGSAAGPNGSAKSSKSTVPPSKTDITNPRPNPKVPPSKRDMLPTGGNKKNTGFA